jgi:phosphoribosylanthranilate isomerase
MRLKICGVQSLDEAERLVELGVDFLGLNLVPTSSRHIELAMAKSLAAYLRQTPVHSVALFQDHPLDVVQMFIQEIGPDFVQLHGQENDDYIAQLDVPVIKSMTSDGAAPTGAQYYLLDREVQGQGPAVETSVANKIITTFPERLFLAGGLTPENLPEALRQLRPFAVDIAGGVRTDNKLDIDKVTRVLQIIRGSS